MNIDLRLGDCIEVLDTLEGNSIDTCITDPPYGLRFMGKDWDTFKQNRRTKSQVVNMGSGMKALNHEELLDYQLWTEEWVSKIFRVLKPGALLLSFGGTRTYHRMVSGIEDAGFEIKDTIGWVYGQGFPKSYNLGKGIDKFVKTGNASWNGTGDSSNGALGYTKLQYEQGYRPDDYSNRHQSTGEITTEEGMLWNGWGTALKPAMELIVVAMKPVDGTYAENALKWGVAGFWIDGGRIPYAEDEPDNRVGTDFISRDGDASLNANDNQVPNKYYVQMYKPQGRFPANFLHDGSDEVLELFPETKSGSMKPYHKVGKTGENSKMPNHGIYGLYNARPYQRETDGDSGSAARFFYCAKASRSERNAGLESMPLRLGGSLEGGNDKRNGKDKPQLSLTQNHHPTVKPLELLRYLVRLTKTPTGGIVLDPFMGSGTTGCACALEGRDFIGVERELEYFEIAEKRISYWANNLDKNSDM